MTPLTPATQNGLHVAIIMDGNGRWAQARALPRTAGHRAGVIAVRRAVKAAPLQGIRVLTLYAFSTDNWKRPPLEVRALMRLFDNYLRKEVAACIEQGVRIEVIGRRDRLPTQVQEAIVCAEALTAGGSVLTLRLAIDYSSREAIVAAASRGPSTRAELAGYLNSDIDLLIRTSGEQRLSDFMLWECAYAELYFTDTPWPDFDAAALVAAMTEFRRRQRRFGGLEGVHAMAAAS